MTRWRQANVDEPAAIALLTEYFASRAETFPAEMGEYRPTFPTPEDFVPPRGLFLIVESAATFRTGIPLRQRSCKKG